MTGSRDGARAAELELGLRTVEARIDRACAAAGRARDEVRLIVVTKTYPASDVRLLAALGVDQVGESRDQEAAAKASECADLGLSWHFVGRLQRNKARSVASYADVVHSVDRPAVLPQLGHGAQASGREVGVLIQVSLDGDPDRGGVGAGEVPALADAVAGTEALRLRGVMAVAAMTGDPVGQFARLREVAELVRADHPGADWISAGMSGDLEAAVGQGATHLRVGTAVLGSRPPLR